MDNWKRLSVPIVLGLAAAGLNWYSVSRKVRPTSYVAVKRSVSAGEKITKGVLVKVDICGDHGLERAALPWGERSLLYGWRATRNLQRGDLVLRRDANPVQFARSNEELVFSVSVSDIYVPNHIYVDDFVSFALGYHRSYRTEQNNAARFDPRFDERQIGPFRIVAVEDELTRDTETASHHRVNELTLSVPGDEFGHARMQRLLDAFNHQGGQQVLSIILHGDSPDRAGLADLADTTTPSASEDGTP